MSDPKIDQIKEIFLSAMECHPRERDDFLLEACRDDMDLYEKVRSLIVSRDDAFSYFEKPAWNERLPHMGQQTQAGNSGTLTAKLPFERLGDYRLIKRIGEGGMGVVYLAEDERRNQEVALKIIRTECTGSEEVTRRFLREMRAVESLIHPNILTVFETGKIEGVLYIAMAYVPGNNLNQVLYRSLVQKERIRMDTLLSWGKEIAAALDCAHRKGIIHRDVKPTNIRITPEGRAMLMDFGMARHLNLSALTATGDFRGTPHYASPELVLGDLRKIDGRTDVYSLGVTLYEVSTGRVPFEGDTVHQVFHQILEKEPVPPRRLKPTLSEDLETLLLKCLEKDPRRRYAEMSLLLEDLKRLQRSQAILAKPPGTLYKVGKFIQRHRMLVFGTVFLFLIVCIGIFATSRQANKIKRIASNLARELSVSRIEKGHALLEMGQVVQAEEIFWSEYFNSTPQASEDGMIEASAEEIHNKAHWGLWTLYRENPCLKSFTLHDEHVRVLDINPKGDLLASYGGNGTIWLYGLQDGMNKRIQSGYKGRIKCIRFSPDGKFLASVGEERPLCIHDVRTGKIINYLSHLDEEVHQIEWHPNGEMLALRYLKDNRIYYWRPFKNGSMHLAFERKCKITYMVFSRNINKLAVSDTQGNVFLLDATTLDKLDEFNIHPVFEDKMKNLLKSKSGEQYENKFKIRNFIFDPSDSNDNRLYITKGHWVALIDFSTKDRFKLLWGSISIRTFAELVSSISMNYDGGRILCGLFDGSIYLLEATNRNKYLFDYKGHNNIVEVRSGFDDDIIVSSCYDGLLRLWEQSPRLGEKKLPGHSDTVFDVAFSPDGQMLASAGVDKTIRFWDVESGKLICTPMNEHLGGVSRLVFHPKDSRTLVSGGHTQPNPDCSVRLWRINEPDDRLCKIIGQYDDWISSIAYSPDGKVLATATGSGGVILRHGATGESLAEFSEEFFEIKFIDDLAFSPGANHESYKLAISTYHNKLVLFSFNLEGKIKNKVKLDTNDLRCRCIAFNPEGRILVAGNEAGGVLIFSVDTGECLHSIIGHSSRIMDVAFSPDGRFFATAAYDGKIILWDAHFMSHLTTLKGHTQAVFTLDFHPNLNILASAGADKIIRLWDLDYYNRHIQGNADYWKRKIQSKPRNGKDVPAEF